SRPDQPSHSGEPPPTSNRPHHAHRPDRRFGEISRPRGRGSTPNSPDLPGPPDLDAPAPMWRLGCHFLLVSHLS
ncbi:MAG: hypothetical protein ACRDS0_32040, partial [Pseudonocardiaceae bacterium]